MPYTSYIYEELKVTKAFEFKEALKGTKFLFKNNTYTIVDIGTCLYSLHGSEPWSLKVKAVTDANGISMTREFSFYIDESLIDNNLDYKNMMFGIVNGEIVASSVGQEVLNQI